MKKVSILLIAVISIYFYSCSTNYEACYEYQIPNAKEITNGRFNYNYSDNEINLLLDFAPKEIGIQLQNKTPDTLKIIWDKSYLAIDGKTFHFTHYQEQFDKNRSSDTVNIVRPSSLAPDSIIYDQILNRDGGKFFADEMHNKTELEKTVAEMNNKNITLNLYLESNSNKKELSFPVKIIGHYIIVKG